MRAKGKQRKDLREEKDVRLLNLRWIVTDTYLFCHRAQEVQVSSAALCKYMQGLDISDSEIRSVSCAATTPCWLIDHWLGSAGSIES